MKADKEATRARHFFDARSYIAPDGREILYGKDWEARKIELHIRSNGWCERFTIWRKGHDAWCLGRGEEPHHIIQRSKGRDDRLENLANLSHACHSAEDPRKVRSDRAEHLGKQ